MAGILNRVIVGILVSACCLVVAWIEAGRKLSENDGPPPDMPARGR